MATVSNLHDIDMSASIRRKLSIIRDDIREIRDQGRRALEDSSQVTMFKGMFNTLDALYKSYSDSYYELCDLSDANGEAIATAADSCQRNTVKRYMQEANMHTVALNDLNRTQHQPQGDTTVSCCNQSRARAKLPTIPLVKFNGDRTKWPRFRDLFESLVIGDDQLREVDKFHYLVSCLEEPAAATISKLPITETNFTVAWTSLKEIYDNQRLLAGSYLDQLLDLKALIKKPTAEELSNRVALVSEVVSAIRILKIPDFQEFLFFHVASRSLDPDTRIAFENANDAAFPKFDSLVQFLRKRSTAAALAGTSDKVSKVSLPPPQRSIPIPRRSWMPRHALFASKAGPSCSSKRPSNFQRKNTQANSSNQNSSIPCFVCGGNHSIINCIKFCSAPSHERLTLLKNWTGCRNCLQVDHATHNCRSKWRCRFCKDQHHSMLHPSQSNRTSENLPSGTTGGPQRGALFSTTTTSQQTSSKPRLNHHAHRSQEVEVMLGTALCLLGSSEPSHKVRLVIDSGSHSSFITRECAERIGLHVEPHNLQVLGIGETPLRGFKGQAFCTLSSVQDAQTKLSLNAIVVENITLPLPGFDTSSKLWSSYRSYDLADPEFWKTRPVDFLLGCDLFGDILTGQIIIIEPGMPKLVGTIFGYTVLGRLQELSGASHASALCSNHSTVSDALTLDLQRFWALEEPPAAQKLSPEDEQCERLFIESHRRTEDGRYIVKLPFKADNPLLPGSRNVALKRLTHMESKLERNPQLKQNYHEFMRDYLKLGHMRLAMTPGRYIIPHHCVVKGEGTSMKVRVVFDAAARTPNGSLNDMLCVGPKLQASIASILLNFRLHKYVFTTDAVKMFRQILVADEDCTYQHILWRFDPSHEVEEYELSTVSYGQTCAPYLAQRVVQQLVSDEGHAFPLAAQALARDLYVDDIASGADTLPLAAELIKQLILLFGKGGFQLSKWSANHSSLLEACNAHDPAASVSSEPVSLETLEDSQSVKILGLQWDPRSDTFSYKIAEPTVNLTKRGVLSATAKIYDPLGYLGPAVVVAKLIIQEAWKREIGWDDTLPLDLRHKWENFVKELTELGHIGIPRHVLSEEPRELRILVFADASEKAYCATAYLHIISSSSLSCHLIMAKTKLAPVKTLTVPRLELCAAVLACRLRNSLNDFSDRLPLKPTTWYFTDSTVVLAWLQIPSFRLKTFVANRVETILELSSEGSWHHVSTLENPSDLGSRGTSPSNLVRNTLWFQGPSWVTQQPSMWPLSNSSHPTNLPDVKPVASCSLLSNSSSTPPLIDWMCRISSYTKLVRSFAYALRFINRSRRLSRSSVARLSLTELRHSEHALIKAVQAHDFFGVPAISDNSDHETPKNLLSLNPFFSDSGLLLVGGRIDKSNISWSGKHPILLPHNAHLSELIIQHYHRSLLHPGATILLAALRNKYWLIGARNSARRIARSCVICRKHSASLCQPMMGELPSCRFVEGRAFRHVGVDFAGPFLVKESSRRRAPQYKCYLCLFLCLSSRALHLEAVTSLSSEAFIASLRRFVGRRGLPERLYSDNGTNFVGAYHELKELYAWYGNASTQDDINSFLAEQDVDWSFSPPSGASFGGGWEAGVKSVKRLMRTVYGEGAMTLEQLGTLFIEIERILNSRPLCPMTNDPNDVSYLSPAHLLIGSTLLDIPAPTLLDLHDNRLSQWELVEKKSQHFWQRWSQEYISSLQRRVKWQHPDRNLQVGDLVIVKDESSPRKRWPLARVSHVHPGKDDIVRVVTLRVYRKDGTRELKRPVNKLVPLFAPSGPLMPSNPTQSDESINNRIKN